MDFHSHFSDDSTHHDATAFDHMKKFIHCIYQNKLFIKYGIIYDTKDGCSKQYRSANEMWIFSVLEFTHIVIIDRLVNAPGDVRIKIDDFTGSENTYLKQIVHYSN